VVAEKTYIDQQVGWSVLGVNLIGRPPAPVRTSILELQGAIEAVLAAELDR
jgi:hypothetical protein